MENKTMNYAVVFTYDFGDEVSVYLFPDEPAAKKFLADSYKEELRIDIEENSWKSCGFINKEGTYAKIETFFEDHSDVTKMRIATIYQ